MSALFNYSPDQDLNIHMRLHPDCGREPVCSVCGASEEIGGGVCDGDLAGLALDLFQEAACSARNANIKSIGQHTNWLVHDRQARAFDAAARAVFRLSAAPDAFLGDPVSPAPAVPPAAAVTPAGVNAAGLGRSAAKDAGE